MAEMKPGALAAATLADVLDRIAAATDRAMGLLGPAVEYRLAQDDPTGAADLVASVQRAISRLRDVESLAARAIGQSVGHLEGTLSDGRTFTVRRKTDRKAWDHDRWQHDARAKVLDFVTEHSRLDEAVAYVVDSESGEMVDDLDLTALVQDAMTAIESVHGAGAPRVTVLKGLGLDPGDYCETVKGAWTMDAIAPNPTPATTTDSGEQNG